MIVLIAINHLTSINYLAGWHNIRKCGQLCVKKFKISIFDRFFDFECMKMMDIAENDSTICHQALDYHQLPGWMTQLCKMKLKKLKKVKKFDFWSHLRFWQFEKSRRLKKSKSLKNSSLVSSVSYLENMVMPNESNLTSEKVKNT